MPTSLEFPLTAADISAEIDGVTVRRSVLPNGLRVLTESVPSARSTSIGFWVGVGSRDEQAERNDQPASLGSTHFLEHLLFKGTPTRSAIELSSEFDRVGANNNAATAKETTSYYAKVRAEDLPLAVTLLSDMVCNSVIDPQEFETERGVILEELAMADDDLADVAHEAFFSAVFGDHVLGRPIGGTPDTIRAAARDAVNDYYHATYRPSQLVVTAAGAVNHDALVAQLITELDGAGGVWSSGTSESPCQRRSTERARFAGGGQRLNIVRPSAQTHTLIGCEGMTATDPRRFAEVLLAQVLGGGMSSRLFQEIREKRGLAYSTYAFGARYSDSGLFGMYAATTPTAAEEAAQVMRDELARIADAGITEEERDRVLGQLAGSSTLALENSGTRMNRLANAELTQGEYQSIDAVLAQYDDVTNNDIRELAHSYATSVESRVMVGPDQNGAAA